ncbi:AAA family ATPase [Pendulispora albinea]|uniref:AAA family ATPase n=2 Tax=Pendulispora albinea TaxID=2741071 RepID=A0ABZ2LZV8_9BACT
MGNVFRATDRLNGRAVALKLLGEGQPSDSSVQSANGLLALAREFQTLSSLHHPNVIRVLDYGFDELAGPYFTMELLDDPRFITQEAQEQYDTSLEAKLALLAQLLRALLYVHRCGIVHRDLKPSNVLCLRGVVRLADFGLATMAGNASELAGTPQYIAPEIWFGSPPSVASDLYSFGVIAHEVLFGRPLAGSRRPGLDWLTAPEVELPGATGAIVAKLLARKPEERYESAFEVLRDLNDKLGVPLDIETVATRESFLQASSFVGRDCELGTLMSAFDAASQGQGAGWLIGGESGIGKSRLTAELRTRALVSNACVVMGQAAVAGDTSYALWIPVLRTLAVRAPLPDDDAAVLRELVPDLPELLGRALPSVGAMHPSAMQTRLWAAIDALFRRQPQVTVVLLEDLQWANAESVALLAHLAEEARSLPLLLVGTYRDEEAPELAQTLAATSTLRLRRLERTNVAKLAVSMLGAGGGSSEVVDYLCRETEGNVFFLIEVLRALAEQAGRLDRIGEFALPEGLLTGGIERIALRRVDRVPAEERGPLELAAVLGRDLDRVVLQRLLPELALDRWLAHCANAAVLESRGDDFRFAHDKLRDAILARIPPERRRTLHAQVASAMESLYEGPLSNAKSALLAYHFHEAGEHARAAHFSVRAGDYATRLCSYGEARAHYAAAMSAIEKLEVTSDTRRWRIDLLLKQIYTLLVAESAEQNFKRVAEARALLAECEKNGGATKEDRARLARLDYFHGRIHFYRGETPQALGYYRKALPMGMELGDEELIALPSCLIGSALIIDGNAKEAEPLLAQAIGPLERLGEPFEWFRAVGYHGLSLVAQGLCEAGFSELDRVRARAREIGQPSLLSAANLMTGSTCLFSGDWPLVIEFLEYTLEFAGQTGDKLHLSLAWSGMGWAYSHMGQHEKAEDCRAKAQRIADTMGGRLMLNDWYRAGDAEIALNAGDHDQAMRRARELLEEHSGGGKLFSRGVAERVRAEVAAAMGDHDLADEHLRASIAFHERGAIHVQVARTRFRAALQLRRRGDASRERANELYQRALGEFRTFRCDYAVAECQRVWCAEPEGTP